MSMLRRLHNRLFIYSDNEILCSRWKSNTLKCENNEVLRPALFWRKHNRVMEALNQGQGKIDKGLK